ncbi:hypothetical protein S7711_10102 [Stachybotrys chartarum IBT 7711]|uniref:Heterokaryon incompatibility domain-containing protein n=1 Tax=Stachybotrys chartarum (strain CBS 109288 / IBT 7711) TaxID=1280523 RepID=A0A084B1L6_STACB|nr:hypothetical protein S7711_10102 [Stachybotrys chartarum IBT 7711]
MSYIPRTGYYSRIPLWRNISEGRLRYPSRSKTQYAKAKQSIIALKAALEAGLDPNVQWRDYEVVWPLPKTGCMVKSEPPEDESWPHWNTPLHLELWTGNLESAEILLVAGADVDVRNSMGYTPLHEAVWCRRYRVLDWLVHRGADLNARTASSRVKDEEWRREFVSEEGILPLHIAMINGDTEMVERLLSAGACPNAEGCGSWLLLDLAVFDRQASTMSKLIKYGGRFSKIPAGLVMDDRAESHYRNSARDILWYSTSGMIIPPQTCVGAFQLALSKVIQNGKYSNLTMVLDSPEQFIQMFFTEVSQLGGCLDILAIDKKLCSRCLNIQEPITQARFTPYASQDPNCLISLHPNQMSLKASANEGCQFCALLLVSMEEDKGGKSQGFEVYDSDFDDSGSILNHAGDEAESDDSALLGIKISPRGENGRLNAFNETRSDGSEREYDGTLSTRKHEAYESSSYESSSNSNVVEAVGSSKVGHTDWSHFVLRKLTQPKRERRLTDSEIPWVYVDADSKYGFQYDSSTREEGYEDDEVAQRQEDAPMTTAVAIRLGFSDSRISTRIDAPASALLNDLSVVCKTSDMRGTLGIGYLDDRVIFVGNETSPPHLVNGAGVCAPYYALSYCWGTTKARVTTKQTLEEHMQALPVENLAKTIREAIQITRKLGIDYLWVDALCIIQDDEIDWATQAALMHRIYSNAELTLSSLHSKDCDDGLITEKISSTVGIEGTKVPNGVSALEIRPHADEGTRAFKRMDSPGASPEYAYALFRRRWAFILGMPVFTNI